MTWIYYCNLTIIYQNYRQVLIEKSMIPSKMSWARFPFSKSRVVILKICSCGRSIAYEYLEMIIEIMLLANNPRRFLFIRTCLDTYVCYVKYVMDGCTIQTKSTICHKNDFPQKYHSMAKMWLFTSYGNKQIYM